MTVKKIKEKSANDNKKPIVTWKYKWDCQKHNSQFNENGMWVLEEN